MEKTSTEKNTFLYIFVILALVLLVMPFIATFNDLLTRVVMSLDFYRVIQNYVVPWEVRMVGVLLWPLGFKPAILGEYLALTAGGQPFLIEIVWNCIGWQSLLFFVITALVGFQGGYTRVSKLKALAIGLLGTFLINLLRIAAVALFAYFFGQFPAIIFHDYGSTLAVIGWLFGFWWFVYGYVLEPREAVAEVSDLRESEPRPVNLLPTKIPKIRE